MERDPIVRDADAGSATEAGDPPGSPDRSHRASPYSARQRWYIAAAVSLLIVIMVGVAFASGVYVGGHREIAPAADIVSPGGRPQGRGQPGPQRFGQPQAAAPAGVRTGTGGSGPTARFDLVGTVSALNEASISIATPQGSTAVALSGVTRIETRDGRAVSLAEIHKGSLIGLVLTPGTAEAASLIVLN